MHLAVEAGPVLDPEAATALARAAEAAGFALITFADSPVTGRVEAGVAAAFLSRRTGRIGLAPTLQAAVTEPFHLATQLASLDHASLGRGAWVVGADDSAAAHATIGSRPLGEPRLRQELADVVDVVRQLWDSWEDDAVIRDTASGRFLDADRVHHVAFTGARFSVVGPLITPRPPQGQLVVLGADTLGITSRLDVALIAAPDTRALARRAEHARAEGAPLVFAEIDVAPGGPDSAGRIGIAPRGPDGAAQADVAPGGPDGGPGGRLRHTGDPAGLRRLVESLADVVDGVRLHLSDPAGDLTALAGALPADRTAGPTLRHTLGLARPANRFATAAREDRS